VSAHFPEWERIQILPDVSREPPAELCCRSAVLDGEIVCLDRHGKTQFKDLLFRRGEPRFYAFDLLWVNGEDLRHLTLIDRKDHSIRTVPSLQEFLLKDQNA
jgi:ATP-dependent DNA ligase